MHDYTKPQIWDVVWSKPYENYNKHHQTFWNLIRQKAHGKVLDMACGPASYWSGLPIELYGCDFSDFAITEAVKNNLKGHFLIDDLPTHYYDGMRFDTVVMSGLVNYYQDLKPFMDMAILASRPGSLIIITINVIDDFPGRHWDMNEIENQFLPYGVVRAQFYPKIGWLVAIETI